MLFESADIKRWRRFSQTFITRTGTANITCHISHYHFSPRHRCIENLLRGTFSQPSSADTQTRLWEDTQHICGMLLKHFLRRRPFFSTNTITTFASESAPWALSPQVLYSCVLKFLLLQYVCEASAQNTSLISYYTML